MSMFLLACSARLVLFLGVRPSSFLLIHPPPPCRLPPSALPLILPALLPPCLLLHPLLLLRLGPSLGGNVASLRRISPGHGRIGPILGGLKLDGGDFADMVEAVMEGLDGVVGGRGVGGRGDGTGLSLHGRGKTVMLPVVPGKQERQRRKAACDAEVNALHEVPQHLEAAPKDADPRPQKPRNPEDKHPKAAKSGGVVAGEVFHGMG